MNTFLCGQALPKLTSGRRGGLCAVLRTLQPCPVVFERLSKGGILSAQPLARRARVLLFGRIGRQLSDPRVTPRRGVKVPAGEEMGAPDEAF